MVTVLALLYIAAFICAAAPPIDTRVAVVLLCVAGLLQVLPIR